MRATSTRHGKRQVYVAGIMVLAGVFLYRGMCSLSDSSSAAAGEAAAAAATAAAAADPSCDWQEGGPELFVIRHNKDHPEAGHWFHVAECFTGRRADLSSSNAIGGMSGTVYLQVLDPSWMADLSPMSRLLIASALTSAGTSNVHFVDADRASFSYSRSGSTSTSTTPPRERGSALVEGSSGSSSGSLAPARKGRGETDDAPALAVQTQGGGATRDGPHRRQQQQGHKKSAGATESTPPRPTTTTTRSKSPNDQPRKGQVGLLEFDPRGRGSEFVVSSESSLPERLTVTAAVRRTSDNQEGGGRGGGGAVRGGGREDTSYGGQGQGHGDSGREPVCVRYLKTVGQKAVQRKDWFPSPEDARSLRAAIDTYCPVPFLRDESERERGRENEDRQEGEREGGGRHRRVEEDDRQGGGGGDGGAGGGRVRRLLLYQRDQNRQIKGADQVIEDLQQRLGGGWVVEEMMHDSGRHPCELVEALGGVDVLLTAHGFQSMLGLFMRPGSLLFEVFPHKYFKAGYAPMAEGLGVRHAFSMSRPLRPLIGFSHPSTETCMKWYLCRWYSRGSDVELDGESLDRLVELALVPAF